MKKIPLFVASLLFLGVGCFGAQPAVVPQPSPVQQTQVYQDLKLGFEFEYPQGWHLERIGSPGSDVLNWEVLQPVASKDTEPSTQVIIVSKKGKTFAAEAARPGAITGEINGKFYVINHYGDAAASGFNLVAETFTILPITASQTPPSTVYTNSQMGFSLALPTGWFLPGTTETDPHFYATKTCSEQDWIDCSALEIQRHDDLASQADQLFNDSVKKGNHPVKTTTLISGATVIAHSPDEAAEGWSYEYDVFFTAQNKMFLIFTNDVKLETTVLPTFKLIK